MKLIHLSDLHLGKRLSEVSLEEDQRFILSEILRIVDDEKPDAVLICGDIYDRRNPSAEAMSLFSSFIHALKERGCPVLAISGNHDAPDRVAYFRELVTDSRVYLSPVYDGSLTSVTLEDELGPVDFWLMPYIEPAEARIVLQDDSIRSHNDAVAAVLARVSPDSTRRHVILSHQYIAGSTNGGSERRVVGTIEDVDSSLYEAFDYVALGHIHKPQAIGRKDGTMRYCGTPLRYSSDEGSKTLSVVELREKGNIRVRELPLKPLHEVHRIKGAFDELLKNGPEPGTENDFFYITLTDRCDIKDAASRLRERFGLVMELSFAGNGTNGSVTLERRAIHHESTIELLKTLYETMMGEPMSDRAGAFAEAQILKVEGDAE